ncbi:MAG: hypothetical protein ACRDBQ_18520 [Shewanella sp.]
MSPISIDRDFGLYNISIGTSLSLEGLFRTGEFASEKKGTEIHGYQEIMINLRTLFRNAHDAFRQNRDSLKPEVLKDCILQDLEGFIAAVKTVAPEVVCVPYFCTYKGANREFPTAKFRNANTPLQIYYKSLEDDVYRALLNEENKLIDAKIFDVYPSNNKDTLILTHYPADLLARKDFPKLALLESHSGKVKTHLEWNTKLYNKPPRIPFNKAFLVVFGDTVMLSPQDLKMRNVLNKTAEKYKWDQTTTMDRINNCLKLVNEPHIIDFLRRVNR